MCLVSWFLPPAHLELFWIFLETNEMGRVYEALRPHMSEFCDVVDPADLMRQLPQLRPCDWVGLHLLIVFCGICLLQCIIVLFYSLIFIFQLHCFTLIPGSQK